FERMKKSPDASDDRRGSLSTLKPVKLVQCLVLHDVELSSGETWVIRTIAKSAEDPRLVLALRRHDAEGGGPFPDDFAATCNLEQASGAALTDQHVVVGQSVRARNVGTVKLLFGVRRVMPCHAVCLGIDFHHRRSWLAHTVVAIVEHLHVA